MNALTAYTPLESLLLFKSLAKYGAEPSAFSKISDLLKGNPLVRQAKTFDTGRLSPDALRELYLSLLKEDSSGENGRNGVVDATEESQSNSRKRKLQSPPIPDSTQQAQRLPQLVQKLYVRYKEIITKSIREDERRYQTLQQEVQEIERGEWNEQSQSKGTPQPSTPTHPTTPQAKSEATLSDSTLPPLTGGTGEVSSKPSQLGEAFAQNEFNDHGQTDETKNSTSTSLSTPISAQEQAHGIPNEGLQSQPSQGSVSTSVEPAVKGTDHDSGNNRLSTRPKSQHVPLLPRSQSSEPRVSNYSRHYVIAPPPSQLLHANSSAPSSVSQSTSTENQNSTSNAPARVVENTGRAEGEPTTSSGLGSNQPQSQEPHQTTTPSISSQTGQLAQPEVAASTATSNAPPSPNQQIQAAGSQYRQVMPATPSSRGNPPARLSQLIPYQTPLLPLAPLQQSQGQNLITPVREPVGHPSSPSQAQTGQSNVPQTKDQACAPDNVSTDLRPTEPGKQSPHVQAGVGRNQGTDSPLPIAARPTGRQILPSPTSAQTPVSGISRLPHLFATPNRNPQRPPPIDTSLPPSRSFKPFDPSVLPATPGSPVRPGPEDISPISAPTSPISFPEPAKTPKRRGKRAREEEAEEALAKTEGTNAEETEARKTRSGKAPSAAGPSTRKTRAGSVASSTVQGSTRARSQSFSSHAGDVIMTHDITSAANHKIKPEQPPSPSRPPLDESTDIGGDTTADEGMRLGRGRRKQREDMEEKQPKQFQDTPMDRDITQPAADPSAGQQYAEQQYVLSTRNFARTSATIMNDIGSHKYASIFSSPVKERDAPGYKDLIYRPQDLRSIKSAIAAGGKAVAAAVGAINVNGGTPADSAPSPGPVGTAVAKNTSLWIPISPEVVPPRGIINSAQLEKELMRMFANAIMFNPGPKSGFGNAFKQRSEDVDEDEEEVIDEEEDGGVVKDSKEMFGVVEKAVADWRSAERAVENLSGKPPTSGSFAARARLGTGKEKEEEVTDEQGGDGGTEEKDDSENITGTVRKRRRL